MELMVNNMQSTYLQEIQAEFDRRSFIEDVGMIFKESALPRMAGKIFGSLLICYPPYQSAGELMTYTGGSKASISTMTRLLIQLGLIERTGIPDKKGIYFKLREDSYSALIERKMTFIRSLKATMDKGLNLISPDDKERRHKLEEIRDLYLFFEEKLPTLIELWKKDHPNRYYI
jgi:DNA-binding transcriptional regulator GbsR (MarR family)